MFYWKFSFHSLPDHMFTTFSNVHLDFFLFIFDSLLHILDFITLSMISIENIFLHSMTYIFTVI